MMMKKKITVAAVSVVGDIEMAKFGAVLEGDNYDISFYHQHLDKEACREHKDIRLADQAEFESMVYDLQDQLRK